MINLNQEWRKPKKHSPIVIFGAGSIVNDAHLPAYKQAGFKVQGIYDPDIKKAQKLASKFNVSIFNTAEEASNQQNVIFDLATPPKAHASILEILPENAGVLIQKPMGSNLHEATKILEICNARSLKAALNFQLRFAPIMIALKDALKSDEKEKIESKLKTLSEASVGIAQKAFEEAQASTDSETTETDSKEENVVDAEYEEVDSEENKNTH